MIYKTAWTMLAIVTLIVGIAIFSPNNSHAAATNACGAQPNPPATCQASQAQCVCTASGQCQWMFFSCK